MFGGQISGTYTLSKELQQMTSDIVLMKNKILRTKNELCINHCAHLLGVTCMIPGSTVLVYNQILSTYISKVTITGGNNDVWNLS